MKNRKMLLVFVVVTLCLSSVISAVAAEWRTVKLDAVYRDIKIYLYGEEFIPTDVNGKVVEPFIVDGTTYVPLRAIGEAFDLDVYWDSSTSSILIDSYEGPYYPESPLPPSKKVEVSTAEELVKAIAPDTCITLKAGIYDLSKVAGVDNPYVYWEHDHYYETDSKTLVIDDVEGLTLQAAPGADVEIVTPWRFANVLSFTACNGVKLSGIKAGHTITGDYECDAGVLYFGGTYNIVIEDCLLYGSGTIGIELYHCLTAEIINTTVTDCSRRAVDVDHSFGVTFDNCKFIDNRAYQGVIYTEDSSVDFYDCVITGNKSLEDPVVMSDNSSFVRCIFRDNAHIQEGASWPVFGGEWVQLRDCEIEKGNYSRYWEAGYVNDLGGNKLS